MSRTWSAAEVSVLVENYNKKSNEELLKLLPLKSFQAIYKKAYKLGLRKTKEIEHLNRSLAANRGEKSNLWNGGTSTTAKGYKCIKMPEHPRADSKGYVLEHILIFENATGVQVPKNCCVHHLNGIKDDNRIENLCMMTHGAHTAFHHLGTKRSAETRKKISEKRMKKYE